LTTEKITMRANFQVWMWMVVTIGLASVFATYWVRDHGNPLLIPTGIAFAVSAVVGLTRLMIAVRNRPKAAVASHLGGSVQYDSMKVSDALVEECTPDWKQPLSSVKTNASGFFELPSKGAGAVHNLRVTWSKTSSARLRVQIVPDAPPLVVELPAVSVWNRRQP
jgi:hypothetical protein